MKKTIPILIILFILGLYCEAFIHESIHKEIYKNYGVNSTIHYSKYIKMPNLVTVNKDAPENINPDCLLLQMLNEIIGRPLHILYWVFGIIGITIVSKLENINSTLKNKEQKKIIIEEKGKEI